MDILEVTIIFSFFTDCLLPQRCFFFGNVETNPQIMSSNQVGKTLTVTDNLPSLVLWEMATLLQVSSSKKKHAVSHGMRQFSTTLSVFSMWPNVINLVVIHTLFVYAGLRPFWHGSLTKMWLRERRRLFLKLKGVVSWLIDECQLVRAQHIFAVLLEIETLRGLLKKTNSLWLTVVWIEWINFNHGELDPCWRNAKWSTFRSPKWILIFGWVERMATPFTTRMLLSSVWLNLEMDLVSLNFNWAFFHPRFQFVSVAVSWRVENMKTDRLERDNWDIPLCRQPCLTEKWIEGMIHYDMCTTI